jgi:hypothetical protein
MIWDVSNGDDGIKGLFNGIKGNECDEWDEYMAISSDFMIYYGILWGFVLWDSVGI